MPRRQLYHQDTVLGMLDVLPKREQFPAGDDGNKAFKTKLYRERAWLSTALPAIKLPGKEGHFYNAVFVERMIADAEEKVAA